MGLLSAADPRGFQQRMLGILRGDQQQQQQAPAMPTPDPLPAWLNNPAMMQGAQTPPINPMGGPGGQAPMPGMPFQWRGVMPRGYGG